MAPLKGWLNPSYELASSNASVQALKNLYAEVIESGDEKVVGFLKGCPGLAAALVTLPSTGSTGPFHVRALLGAGAPLSNADSMFAVAGSKVYQIYVGTVTTSGTAVLLSGGSAF